MQTTHRRAQAKARTNNLLAVRATVQSTAPQCNTFVRFRCTRWATQTDPQNCPSKGDSQCYVPSSEVEKEVNTLAIGGVRLQIMILSAWELAALYGACRWSYGGSFSLLYQSFLNAFRGQRNRTSSTKYRSLQTGITRRDADADGERTTAAVHTCSHIVACAD